MPASPLQLFAQTISDGFRRKSLVSCSRWAERCRVMGKPYPGPFSFKHYPWSREMHDCDADKWVGQKAAQVGFTEVALDRVFFTLDIKRVDCLYVLPSTTPDATDFSSGRFNPALELSPYLSNLFSDVQNVGHKRAGSTNLYVRGSRSRSGLKSIPVGLIVLDELDEMTQENLSLVSERQAGQLDRQEINISTPTTANRGINFEYNLSTKEHFQFKCPGCNRFIELTFPESLVITADELGDPNIVNTHLICQYCKITLPHESKSEWLSTGTWIPNQSNRPVRGFHINQLYSSTESPIKIAESYLKSLIDPSIEQEFYNSKLGEVHEIKDSRVTDTQIEICKCDFLLRPQIPANRIITMGIDQGSLIHYEINEWFQAASNPNLFSTDINLAYKPKVIDVGTVQQFEELDEFMKRWQVRFAVIDAHPEKRKALEFAARWDGFVYLSIYAEGINGKNMTVWTNEPVISVDRTAWLDLSLGRFKNNSIRLPSNLPNEYKSHIKAQARVPGKDRNGNPVARYVTDEKTADHFGHARNYAEIALPFAIGAKQNYSIQSPR